MSVNRKSLRRSAGKHEGGDVAIRRGAWPSDRTQTARHPLHNWDDDRGEWKRPILRQSARAGSCAACLATLRTPRTYVALGVTGSNGSQAATALRELCGHTLCVVCQTRLRSKGPPIVTDRPLVSR